MEDFDAIGERAAQAIRDRAKKNKTTFEAELKKLNFFKSSIKASAYLREAMP